MKTSTSHHLSQIDRAIVHLLNERARLVGSDPSTAASHEAHVLDLLRRSSGPFPSSALRSTLDAIRAGCEELSR